MAIGYGLLTYFVFYRLIAREDVLLTYLLNIISIITILHLDKIAHRFAERKARVIREEFTVSSPIVKAVFLLGQGFTRTALYFFYIVVLVLSRVEILRPDLIPFKLGDFFLSIEYGILLLFAFDQLMLLLTADMKWFRKFYGRESIDDPDKNEK